jgi:hypothetical protein
LIPRPGIRDERISSSAELMPYISPLSSGLHLLAAPERAEAMAAMTPDAYRIGDELYRRILPSGMAACAVTRPGDHDAPCPGPPPALGRG